MSMLEATVNHLTAAKMICAFAVLSVAGIGGDITYTYGTATQVNFTVTDKTIKTGQDDKGHAISTYLIFTKDSTGKPEVFQDSDSFPYLKFNSSNVYGELTPGKAYTAKVYGTRVPFLSWYRNIVSVQLQP